MYQRVLTHEGTLPPVLCDFDEREIMEMIKIVRRDMNWLIKDLVDLYKALGTDDISPYLPQPYSGSGRLERSPYDAQQNI